MLWVIIGLLIAIFLVIKLFSFFSGGNKTSEASARALSITPLNAESIVYIAEKENNKKPIKSSWKLHSTDAFVLVEQWGANANLEGTKFDLDENTQISFTTTNATKSGWTDTISVTKWKLWVESNSNDLLIKWQNLEAKIPSWSTAIVESTVAFWAVYAISWDTHISSTIWDVVLHAWEKLELRNSDMNSNDTDLSKKVGDITDSTIASSQVFIRNDWENILKTAIKESSKMESNSGSIAWSETLAENTVTESGSIIWSGSSTGSNFIRFTQPIDGATIKTSTVTIMGSILDPKVSSVTINDAAATVSPVNQTFVMQDFKLTGEINNLVYKVYDSNKILLEKWVLTIYWPKWWTTSQKTIIPENFPISAKDFIISFPMKNPYATTERNVKVQGTIPKNTVQYITVNDYKLQKFVPNSTSWYYFANADIGTIKEGTNLYYIKFFDKNNKLLYTQLFTIIKDSKNSQTLTPSANTNDSPLFPAQ